MLNRSRDPALARKWWVVLVALFTLLPASPLLADWQVTDYVGTDEDPAIAWNGEYYLIVWTRHQNDTTYVYGQRVTSSRQFVGDEFPIWDPIVSSFPGDARYAHVASSGGGGSKWLVVWRNEYGGAMEIRGRIVNSDGTLEASVLTVGTTDYFSPFPVVAWNGSKWLVAWEGYESSYRYIEGRLVYTNGTMGTEFVIDQEASIHKYRPRVGALGSNFFAAWMDRRDGVYNIYGKPIDINGNPGARVQVSSCDGTDYTNSVSGGSSYFLVTWRCLGTGGNAHIWGRRVNSAGTAAVGVKFEISSDQINNSGEAAWTGSYFKVAYDLTSLGPYYRPVYEDGSLGSEIDLSSLLSSGVGTYVSNAQGDTNCLCVWEANIGNRDIYTDGTGEVTSVEPDRTLTVSRALSVVPNPLSPGCGRVEFSLDRRTTVRIDVYDIAGRRVATVLSKELGSGEHSCEWNPRGLPSGLYLVRLAAEGGPPVTRKVVYLR